MVSHTTAVREIEFSWAHDCPFNRLTENHAGLVLNWERPAIGVDAETAFGRFSVATDDDAFDPQSITDELDGATSIEDVQLHSGHVFDCILRRDMLTMSPELLAECFEATIREHDGIEEWRILTSSPRVERFLFETLNDKSDGKFQLRRKVSFDDSKRCNEQPIHQNLTRKQWDALRLAHENGYFESPRKVTAEELAAELDITASSFLSRLRRAQREIVSTLLDETGAT